MSIFRNFLLLASMATAVVALDKSICRNALCRRDKKLREGLSEKKIDKMIMDSFPASDPPSTY